MKNEYKYIEISCEHFSFYFKRIYKYISVTFNIS